MNEFIKIYSELRWNENCIEDWFFIDKKITDIDNWIKALVVLEMSLKNKGYTLIECRGDRDLIGPYVTVNHINLVVKALCPVSKNQKEIYFHDVQQQFIADHKELSLQEAKIRFQNNLLSYPYLVVFNKYR